MLLEGTLAKKKPNAKHSSNRNAGPGPGSGPAHASAPTTTPEPSLPALPLEAPPPEPPSLPALPSGDQTTPAMPAFVDPDEPVEVLEVIAEADSVEVLDPALPPSPTPPALPPSPTPHALPPSPVSSALPPAQVSAALPTSLTPPALVDPRDLTDVGPAAVRPEPLPNPSAALRDPASRRTERANPTPGPIPSLPPVTRAGPPSGVAARPLTVDGLRRPTTHQLARATWRPTPPFNVTASGPSGARFRAETEVGIGPYGMTWSGRDLELSRPCHITLFHPALFADPVTKRAQRERLDRALRYHSPHLAPVFGSGEAFGTVWVASAPVIGTPLTHWRRDAGTMRLDDVYRIVGQVLDAVAAIHAQRGVHGGLSPETVRIVNGQAWLTSPWWLSTAGVPEGDLPPLRTAWLAPELLFGEPAESPETDIYGAGLVLGYLLACGLTEPGHSLLVQGIDVPPAVDDVYVHATARQREARFPDVASFRAALEAAAGFEWRDAQKALARSPGTGLVGVEVLAAESVGDGALSEGPMAPFAMPLPPPRDIESTSEDEAIPAFGPDGEPLAETTDADLPPLPEPHVDTTPSRRGRRVVARTLPQGAARGSGLLPVASGLEPIITASPRAIPTAGVTATGADVARGPWDDHARQADARRLETPPSDPLTEEILESLMAPPPELPGPPPLPSTAQGSARVELQGIEVLPSSWAEGSSLEVLDVGPWTPPGRTPPESPPEPPELSESTIVEAIAPALLEIDVFANPPGPAPIDPFAEPADLPPDPWSDSPLRATRVSEAEAPAALSAPLPPRLAPIEGPKTRPEARPPSLDMELGARPGGLDAELGASPPPPSLVASSDGSRATKPKDSGKVPRPATSPRLPPAPSGPLAVSVVESISNVYETPDPLAADPREPRTMRDPSGPLAPAVGAGRSSTLGSGLYVAVPQKGPKTWWLALGAVVIGAIIAFLVLRDTRPAGPGQETVASADAGVDTTTHDASDPHRAEVLVAALPGADAGPTSDTAVASVDTNVAVDTNVVADTAVASVDTAVAIDTNIVADTAVASVDTAVAVDTNVVADTAVASVDTSVAVDTNIVADTAVAAGDIGPSPESFVPVDPAKVKCPDGMSKLKKKIEVTLSTGAKVDDWEVVCIDRYEYPGAGAVPSTGMDQGGARAACAAKQKRLCTRSEWRRACGGTYPYGKEYDATRCNTAGADGSPKSLVAAGSKSGCMSPSGAFDMVGNAAEWTSDGFVNGGTSLKNGEDATCGSGSRRAGGAPHIGFRCCADPK